MNYNEKWDHLFKKFSNMFPSMAAMTVDGYLSGRYEITAILSDGRTAIYDGMTDSARFRRPGDECLSESDWTTEFIFRLKKRMARAGINQRQLADEIGVSQGTISNYLIGRSMPNSFTLHRIAKVLNCSVTELCDF